MRREIVYQYDLPVEVLDEISEDEEVLNVLFGRSKEKFRIPVLFSDKRIFWAYPEKETVYKVFVLYYVDVVSLEARFPSAGVPSLTLTAVNGKKILVPNIQETIDDVRGALYTVSSLMQVRTGTRWPVHVRKSLLAEEYILAENPDEPIPAADDDIFEEGVVVQRQGPEEEIFGHFDCEGEDDVFEEAGMDAAAEVHNSAVVDRVSRLIQSTAPVSAEPEDVSCVKNDAVIYEQASVSGNEQWENEGGGDAEILPERRPRKTQGKMSSAVSVNVPVYRLEDDDSEVYVSSERPQLAVPQPKVYLQNSSELNAGVIEKVTVLPNSLVNPKSISVLMPDKETPVPVEPVMIFRRQKNPGAVTLHPKEGIDEDTLEKSLAALQFLRENKIISEAEYKKRSLSLFEEKE